MQFLVLVLLSFVVALAHPFASPGKLLVLGGTGFVGGEVIRGAVSEGWEVTSVSRRGAPTAGAKGWTLEGDAQLIGKVTWKSGDSSDAGFVSSIVQEGEFDAVVHAIGMLFEGNINRYVSGSGSVPDQGSTYDKVTRQTAVNAMDAFAAYAKAKSDSSSSSGDGGDGDKACASAPFVFMSAAEAGWGFDGAFQGTPVEWLHRYLVAKRAVEDRLLKVYSSDLRGVVLRPSLVWTKKQPLALPSVAAFTVANFIGLPFVDRPVNVKTVAKTILQALRDPSTSGVVDYKGMAKLADAYGKR